MTDKTALEPGDTKTTRAQEANRRLAGWKEIAAFLGKDERTAKRWATERGLPVHRVPGTTRASVYAWSGDIDAWLKPDRQDPAPDQEQPGNPPPSQHGFWGARGAFHFLTLGIAVAALLGTIIVSWPESRTSVHQAQTRAADILPERVHALYHDAGYLWPKRTPEALVKAEKLLNRVVELSPRFADAHADLATIHNLMVEYRVEPAEVGYARSLAAAKRAIEIDPRHAAALTVLGDLSYFWQKKYAEGFEYFRRAIAAEPDNAQARQWYASALLAAGRYSEAAAQISRARDLEPAARSLIVSHAMIQLGMGNATDARAALLGLVQNEPNYSIPYRFLSFAELTRHDIPGYLAALHDWFALNGDTTGQAIAQAGDEARRQGSEAAMVAAMLASVQSDEKLGSVEPYFLAHILALAGDWQGAAAQLSRIPTRHAFYYSIDPAFDEARRNPQFRQQLDRLGLPVIPGRKSDQVFGLRP